MFSEDLVKGTHDYRWLLDRSYPENGSIALVGDRYRLSGDERHMLFRGVSSREAAERRFARIIGTRDAEERIGAGAILGIDGHNVLLTVANYLRGVPTFECDDGLLRDIGGVHGRFHDGTLMQRAIDLTADTIAAMVERAGVAAGDAAGGGAGIPGRDNNADSARIPDASPLHPPQSRTPHALITVYLDAPVSHSGTHADRFRDALADHGVPCTVQTTASADAALRDLAPGVLATSDSALIDQTAAPVCDLARSVLLSRLRPEFDSFREILSVL